MHFIEVEARRGFSTLYINVDEIQLLRCATAGGTEIVLRDTTVLDTSEPLAAFMHRLSQVDAKVAHRRRE